MGLGKTITLIALALHRAEQGRGTGPDPGRLPGLAARQLGGRDPAVRPRARRTPVPRPGPRPRRPRSGGTGSCSPPTGRCGSTPTPSPRSPWDLVVADEAQHVKNARSATARALRTHPVRRPGSRSPAPRSRTSSPSCGRSSTGRRPGCSAAATRSGVPGRRRSRRASTRRRPRGSSELVAPFLLRRRKSDPGIAPELPPKTETDHLLSLTREQVVLYEAFVRDCLERIERADEHAAPRAWCWRC